MTVATINAEVTQELKVFLSDQFTSYTRTSVIMHGGCSSYVHWVSVNKTTLQHELAPPGHHITYCNHQSLESHSISNSMHQHLRMISG